MEKILAAALFAVTRHMRMVTTIHASWFHPLLVARIGANLNTLFSVGTAGGP